MVVLCAGCQLPIQDKFLLTVLDRTWHCACVQCADCRCFLVDKCFSRDGNLYCRQDFFRRYGTQCAGCRQGISPDDLVRRAPVVTSSSDAKTTIEDAVYHVECFACAICRRQLRTGEKLYVVDRNRFVCRDDCTNDVIGNKVNNDNVFSMSDEDDEDGVDADEYNAASAADDCDSFRRQAFNVDDNERNRYVGDWSPGATTVRHVTPGVGSGSASSATAPLVHRSSSPEGSSSCADLIFGPPTERTSTGARRRGRPSSLAEMTDDSNGSEGTVDSGNNNSSNNVIGHKDGGCRGDARLTVDDDRTTSVSDDEGLPLTAVDDGFTELSSGGQQGPMGSSTGGASLPPGAKRRGPRTTIKAKQLDTLKAAFAATPKPTRHIREQLARETGLNMRVIQVWFQNRRSKDRRIKQLNALGIRRQFFRGAHRALRSLRPGEELLIDGHHDLFGHPGFAYFSEKDDFYGHRYQGVLYNDYYHELHAGNINCMAAQPPGGASMLLQHHGQHLMNAEHMSMPGHMMDASYVRHPSSHHPLSVSGVPAIDSAHQQDSIAVLPTTIGTADHPVSCDVMENSRRSPTDVPSYQRCSNPMRSVNYANGGVSGTCDATSRITETSLQTVGCGLTQQSSGVQQTCGSAIESW